MDEVPDGVPPNPDSPAERRCQMQASVHEMRNSQDLLREHIRLQAQATRHTFLCLLQEGFSDQQALDLIKARGPML